MVDYLQCAKLLADSLASSDNPILNSDLKQVILNGLDTTYNAIVTSLPTTIYDTSMEDFHAHLQAFEARVQAQLQVYPLIPTVNMAARLTSHCPMPSSTHGRQSNHRGRGQSHRNRQRVGPRPQNPHGPCQLCGRKNHAARTCWYCFDRQYNADNSSHSPGAYVATTSTILDESWYPDSGATHHITSDLGNLSLHS